MATAGLARTRRRRPRPVRTAVGVAAALGLLAGCATDAGPDPAPDPGGDDRGTVTQPATPPAPTPGAAAQSLGALDADPGTSEVGALVDGFPAELIPVPEDAVILVTSAVPVGESDVREVSLNIRTSLSTPALERLYRETLTAAGFTEVVEPAPSSSGSMAVQLTFVRSAGDELVSVGVLDVDGGRTVSIGGRIRDAA